MKIIIILILLILVFSFIETYFKNIVLFILTILCGYATYRFVKWLIPKIQYYKLKKDLDRLNSDLDNIEKQFDDMLASALPEKNIIFHDSMDGHDFEYFCADILEKNGFINVEVTRGSGDHGIDILAEKDDITYAIQCKCYSDNVGNAAVQQAHTGKSLYHKDIAVVMTNQYFTPQAIAEAKALGVKLWDRDKLNEMINAINK